MTAMIQGDQVRSVVLGVSVSRAAALLPATTQAAIFNIIGGKVLVTSLVGEVVVVMPATTNTTKVTGNPTTGTDVDWTTAVSTASPPAERSSSRTRVAGTGSGTSGSSLRSAPWTW